MSERVLWVSIRKLKRHEYHQTARYLRAIGLSWSDIYLKLGEVQDSVIKWLSRVSSLLVAMVLIINTFQSGGVASIEMAGYGIEVRISYLYWFASLTFLVFSQQLLNIFAILGVRVSESFRHRIRNFNSGIYSSFHDQDQMALAVPAYYSDFLQHRGPFVKFWSVLVLLAYSTILLPIIALLGFLLSGQYTLLTLGGVSFPERAFLVAGIFVLIVSVLNAVLYFVPLPVKKNRLGVRSFLFDLFGWGHPQLSKRLDD